MKWDSYHDGFVMVEENLVMEEGRVFGRFGVIVSLSVSLSILLLHGRVLAGFVWGGGGIASHSVVSRYLHLYGLDRDGLGFGRKMEFEAWCSQVQVLE